MRKEINYVYILECGNNTLYTGITKDFERRINEHNGGSGAYYTRVHGVKRILAVFRVFTRSSAVLIENHTKTMSPQSKLKIANREREFFVKNVIIS